MLFSDTSRRTVLKVLGAGTIASVAGTGTATARGHGGGPVFEIKQMVGNTRTGGDGTIRALEAGGLPWVIDDAEAKLDGDGTLKVDVEGLVIDPDVDHPAAGTNPVPEFKAVVSCLTLDTEGHVIENVSTGTVPASSEGNAEIEDTVELPDPCLAPIVFVTSPMGSWFAVTGA